MKLKYVLIGIFAISLANNSLAMEKKTSLVQRFNEAQKTGEKLSSNDINLISKNLNLFKSVKSIAPCLFEKNRLQTLKNRTKTAKENDQAIAFVLCGNNLRIIIHPDYNSEALCNSINSTPSCFTNENLIKIRNKLFLPNRPSIILTRNTNNQLKMQTLGSNLAKITQSLDANHEVSIDDILDNIILEIEIPQ